MYIYIYIYIYIHMYVYNHTLPLIMKVLHNSCNTVTCGLPDMSTLSPQSSGVHIRQTTCACVTTIKCIDPTH